MLELVPVVLAGGVKGLLQDSGFLLGAPLVALGVIGVLIVLAPVGFARTPQPEAVAAEAGTIEGDAHPSPGQYIGVGLILAVITAVEVGVYYVDLAQGALLGMLLVLSAVKFVLVGLWFMHLRFDSRIFSTLFTGGLMLAVGLFIVVLASLGASLV
jgi:cytochrome c oxidase subunit 4